MVVSGEESGQSLPALVGRGFCGGGEVRLPAVENPGEGVNFVTEAGIAEDFVADGSEGVAECLRESTAEVVIEVILAFEKGVPGGLALLVGDAAKEAGDSAGDGRVEFPADTGNNGAYCSRECMADIAAKRPADSGATEAAKETERGLGYGGWIAQRGGAGECNFGDAAFEAGAVSPHPPTAW